MQEYTCPLCAGGFIEELPPVASSDRSRSSSSNDDADVPGEFNDHRLNERISSLLMSSIGGGFRAMDDDSDQSSNQEGSSSSICYLHLLTVYCLKTLNEQCLKKTFRLNVPFDRWPTNKT